MKKGLCMLVAIVGIGLLTGCESSGKKLTCSYSYDSDSSEDYSYSMNYVLKFDKAGETLKSYQQQFLVTYSSSITDDEISEELEAAKESCDEYADMSGVKCSATKSGSSITLQLDVNMSKLDDEAIEELSTDEIADFSYDDFKSYMEDSEYTCK